MSVTDTLRELSLADSTTRGAGFESVLNQIDWTKHTGGRYRKEKARMVRCDRWHCPNPEAHDTTPPARDWSLAVAAFFLLLVGFLLCWLTFAAGVL